MEQIHNYIHQERSRGEHDEAIKYKLANAGWHGEIIERALNNTTNTQPAHPTSQPAEQSQPFQNPQSDAPIAVVQNLSARGLEYYLMFIVLVFSAVSLGALLFNTTTHIIDKSSPILDAGSSYMSAVLLVCLPIFILLFIRLKKAELKSPALLKDPSRRRSIQTIMVFSFVVLLFETVGFVFSLFPRDSTSSFLSTAAPGLRLSIAGLAITYIIAGGIFAYYWFDGQRQVQQ